MINRIKIVSKYLSSSLRPEPFKDRQTLALSGENPQRVTHFGSTFHSFRIYGFRMEISLTFTDGKFLGWSALADFHKSVAQKTFFLIERLGN